MNHSNSPIFQHSVFSREKIVKVKKETTIRFGFDLMCFDVMSFDSIRFTHKDMRNNGAIIGSIPYSMSNGAGAAEYCTVDSKQRTVSEA